MLHDPLGMHGVWVNGVRVSGEDHLVDPAVRPGSVLTECNNRSPERALARQYRSVRSRFH